VKSKLENELGYTTLEMNENAVGLLRQLKQMAFTSGGVQHPFWTLQIVMQRLLAINQGPRESVTNYYTDNLFLLPKSLRSNGASSILRNLQ
jgi:hypothetical protein